MEPYRLARREAPHADRILDRRDQRAPIQLPVLHEAGRAPGGDQGHHADLSSTLERHNADCRDWDPIQIPRLDAT